MTAHTEATYPTCPWCGHENDCTQGRPGKSMHHDLCCADWNHPPCRVGSDALAQIMRDDQQDKWSE